MIDRADVIALLDTIPDPISGGGLTSSAAFKGLVVAENRAGFVLEAPRDKLSNYGSIRDRAEALLREIPGIERVSVVLTAESGPPPPRKASLSPQAVDQTRAKAPVATDRPANVRRVLAVASGKGGVGKSTVSVNLAAALALKGLRVGILDADVHGPSIPTMLGLDGKPDYVDGRIVPPQAHGLSAMSVGLLTRADDAMVWRGPMASQALTQMLTQTRWATPDAPLDVLIVDLPPGTGDIQLTLLQKTPLDGALIVTTPQEVALADARRAYALFVKVGVPVLGLIENMTGDIFGRGGGALEADRLGVPVMGEVPLDATLREAGDRGVPLVSQVPGGDIADVFDRMAERLITVLALRQPGSPQG